LPQAVGHVCVGKNKNNNEEGRKRRRESTDDLPVGQEK